MSLISIVIQYFISDQNFMGMKVERNNPLRKAYSQKLDFIWISNKLHIIIDVSVSVL